MIRGSHNLSILEAAQRYLRVESGGVPRPYDPDLTPYFKEPISCLEDPDLRQVVFCGPAQTGKTTVLMAWVSDMKHRPANMQIVHSSETAAKTFTQEKFDPAVLSSPDLAAMFRLPLEEPLLTKQLVSGHYIRISAPTKTALSSRSVPKAFITEIDRAPDEIPGEGSPWGLLTARTKTFGEDGMVFGECSPSRDLARKYEIDPLSHEAPPVTGILGLYNQGDMRRLYAQCPHCEETFRPDVNLFTYPDEGSPAERAAQVHMVCPNHGCLITPGEKRHLLETCHWVKADPQSFHEMASFWMDGSMAAFETWPAIVSAKIRAQEDFDRTGSDTALKEWTNLTCGKPFLPMAIANKTVLDEKVLEARADESFEKRTVPQWVRWLTAAVDVQGDRFEVAVHGWDIGLQSILLDRFPIKRSSFRTDAKGQSARLSPPTEPEDWNVLITQVLLRSYPLQSDANLRMRILSVACDTGGAPGTTPNAYNFWRSLHKVKLGKTLKLPLWPTAAAVRDAGGVIDLQWHLALVKGEAPKVHLADKHPLFRKTFPDSVRKGSSDAGSAGDVPLFLANATRGKDWVHAALSKQKIGPVYLHIPGWMRDERPHVFAELAAEEREEKGWVQIAKRNETLDLIYMQYCMLDELGLIGLASKDPAELPWYALPQGAGNGLVFEVGATPVVETDTVAEIVKNVPK